MFHRRLAATVASTAVSTAAPVNGGVGASCAATTARMALVISGAGGGGCGPRSWLRILAADPVDPVCGQVFRDHGHKLVEKKLTKEELMATVGTYDGLVVRSGVKVTSDIIRAAGSKLKIIGRAGAGVDNIDTVAATRAGVLCMNTPGGNTSAAAELTLSLIMTAARAIPAAVASVKAGEWDRKAFSKGMELKGKTIGIVGLGMIGAEVARRCQVLGMVTLGFDPLVTEEKAAAAGVKKVSLDALYAASDVITLHTPLNDATRNLINKATLAKCKRGVVIINCARGGIVNEGDLLEGLTSGKVGAAGLDVYEQEPPAAVSKALIAHPNVVCTPHLGASTEEAQKKVAREIAQQMCDAFALKSFVGIVNAPHLALAHKPTLEPYVRLSEALGSLQGQLWRGPVKSTSVTVDIRGPVFDMPGAADLLKSALLKGLLPALPTLDLDGEEVNLVNAPMLAAEAAVKVTTNKTTSSSAGSYANLVQVTVDGPVGQRVATGTVIEGQPRVVQLDHWASFPSFAPQGHVLLFNNFDRPGTVGTVASTLSDHNINIASLAIARQFPGSPALTVIICDQRVPDEVQAKIQDLDGITNVRSASFGSGYMSPTAAAASAAAGSGVGVVGSTLEEGGLGVA